MSDRTAILRYLSHPPLGHMAIPTNIPPTPSLTGGGGQPFLVDPPCAVRTTPPTMSANVMPAAGNVHLFQ